VSSESWNLTLDEIEADLVAVEAALEQGSPAPEVPQPAFPAGPIPAELGARAEGLLRRSRDLEARAAEEIDGIRECLRALAGRRPPAPAPTGRIVDVGA
jgi:hypothetical protein